MTRTLPCIARGAAVTTVAVALLAVFACQPAPPADNPPVADSSADALADDARNVRLVGYIDLQGRQALVVTTLSDPANGSWVYVGHHESYWDGKPKPNPITGKAEWNGTSMLDVADPA